MVRNEKKELEQVFLKFLNRKNDITTGKLLEKIKTNETDKYPYYNLISKSEVYKEIIEIEIALAGFEKSDVMVYKEYDQLTIIGKRKSDEKNYIYKGISNRSFRKVFHLFEEVKIESANLHNGMLIICVSLPIETKKQYIEQIEIKET